MSPRQAWVAEIVAIHERAPKPFDVWSRFDRESLLFSVANATGKVVGHIKRTRQDATSGDATPRPPLTEEMGDLAVYLALVARAWSGTVPEAGRCDASVILGRGGDLARKLTRASALLQLGMDDAIGSKVPDAGVVIVPGMVSVALGTLELLAEMYDTTIDDCVAGVLPKIRARFPAPADVAAA